MVKCQFHDDKVPSMKITGKRFHCFGCGAQGSVGDPDDPESFVRDDKGVASPE